jgi:hypothetical protein
MVVKKIKPPVPILFGTKFAINLRKDKNGDGGSVPVFSRASFFPGGSDIFLKK